MSATLIEEGLATNFSREIGDRFVLGYSEGSPAYIYARDLTADFLVKHGASIREIRKIEPSFARFTPELMVSVCPDLESELAGKLCEPFAVVEKRIGGPVRD
jgi:hypothetical protein